MHGAAFVGSLMQFFQGNINVLVEKFDADEVWRLVERHHINSILIVGDAMGRPLIEALDEMEAAGEELDLSLLHQPQLQRRGVLARRSRTASSSASRT